MNRLWTSQDDRGLPQRCHVVLAGLPAGDNVAVCVQGTCGVRMTSIDLGDTEAARRLVRSINDSLGIDAAAEHAMLAGCLVGWNSPLANPAFLRATDRRFMANRGLDKCNPVLH